MFSLKDIADSPDKIKMLFLWLTLIPFWYMSLYLFAPGIIALDDYFLKFSVCIGFTILSSFLGLMTADSLTEKELTKKDNSALINSALSTFSLMAWHCALSFICYTYSLISGEIITFYGFVVIYFLPILYFFVDTLRSEGKKILSKESSSSQNEPLSGTTSHTG